MPTEPSKEPTDAQEIAEKRVAFYGAVVQAWVETRMERDRSLLQLSSLGLGLMATLLLTQGPKSMLHFLLDLAPGLAFLACIFLALWVLHRNAHYLERLLAEEQFRAEDDLLAALDKWVAVAFFVGVALAFLAVTVTAADSIKFRE